MNSIFHGPCALCGNALGGNTLVHQVNGILGDDNVLLARAVNLGNGARILLLALHQKLLGTVALFDTNQHRLVQGRSPVIQKNGFIFHNRQFGRVDQGRRIGEAVTVLGIRVR